MSRGSIAVDVTLGDVIEDLDDRGLLQPEFAQSYSQGAAPLSQRSVEVEDNGGVDFTGVVVRDVEHDSRQIKAHTLFCALRGSRVDGHTFIDMAIERGACAVLVEEVDPSKTVIQIPVTDTRKAMAYAACLVHAEPSTKLKVVGITGTNGKTTTTHMLASLLNTVGVKAAVIGTLSGQNTTPESSTLQRQLANFVELGIEVVALEVSSHGLSLDRVLGTRFEVVAFTNLSQDHLDFHINIEQYFEAKLKLFSYPTKYRLVNAQSPWAKSIFERFDAVSVSLEDIEITHMDLDGTRLIWRSQELDFAIPGMMNIENLNMALEITRALDADPETVARAVSQLETIPGRMQRVTTTQTPLNVTNAASICTYPTVFVDYSHTPEGITKALGTLRDLTLTTSSQQISREVGSDNQEPQISIVFGCGGDRDKSKRPLMAQAAQEGADRVWLTSDNPRSEDPMAIIEDAKTGFTSDAHSQHESDSNHTQMLSEVRKGTSARGGEYTVENWLHINVDRRESIYEAIQMSTAQDVVLIAGKGHEKTQTIGDVTYPFDDVEIAREALRNWSAPK